MLKRFLKIILSIPAKAVYLISGLVTIALHWSKIYAFFSSILYKICLSLMTPTGIMSILFGLSVLNLLLLTFYLLCKNKKVKNETPYSQPKLPPKKYMDAILLLISKSNYLHINDICDNFTENKNIIIHYTDLLLAANFLQRYDKLLVFSILDPVQQPLELSHKGREYLIENKLIP